MIQFIAFLVFTGCVGFFSWRATRRDDQSTTTGYFLAGRSLPWIVVGGSLLLTNLSTEQLVGLNGGAFNNGMQVMAWEVWSSIAIVLMALVFLPRYLKGGVATVSAFLERRYSKAVGTAVSVLLLLSLLTNLLPFVLYSGALFMRDVFDLSAIFGWHKDAPEDVNKKAEALALWVTVIALGVAGSLYAIFGGLKAVAVSDTLNGLGLLIAGLLIPILGLIALGNELGGGGFSGGVDYLLNNKPERLSPIGKEGENIPFSTLFTGMLLITTYYWCTNQAIVQRTFASRSLAQGQKGVLFAAGMKLLGPLYLVLPGIIAWHLFGVVKDGDDQNRVVASVVTEEIGVALERQGEDGFEVIQKESALKKALEIDSLSEVASLKGKTISVGEGKEKKQVTITHVFSKDDVVAVGDNKEAMVVEVPDSSRYLGADSNDRSYGKLVGRTLPGWMLGFFAAVIFGAILSSFNSSLNSAATLFSVDIYKGLINGEASDRQMVKVGKAFGIAIAVGAILLAPMIDTLKAAGFDGLFDLMKNLAALYNIPLLAVVLMGIFHKRVTSAGAMTAIVVGFVFWGVFGLWQDNNLLGWKMHWLHLAAINFVLITLIMVVMALISPREEAYEQAYTDEVDITPWKGAKACGIVILVLIALMYLAMSRFGA